jgi:two-component system chemotaxis response regulator CheB
MTAASLSGRVDAVVIGTSAGGVDALLKILPGLPAQLAVPVLIVIHLPRERDSLLPQVFQPRCARPVREAEDKEAIAPGTVYFAPPDYHLLVDEGPQLALSSDPLVNFSRPSIDVLFESAADAFGARLAAVLLTGASQDGAAGLEAVHRAGGITVVQDPADAQVPVMVESALRRTAANFVLPLTHIERLLATLDVEKSA